VLGIAPAQIGDIVREHFGNEKLARIVLPVVIGMTISTLLAPELRAEVRQIPVALESLPSVAALHADTIVVDLGEPAAVVNAIRLIGGGTSSRSLGAINCCERWPRPTPCVNDEYVDNAIFFVVGSGSTGCYGDWLATGDGSFAMTIDCASGGLGSLFTSGVETMIVEYGLDRTTAEGNAVAIGCWWSLQEPGSLTFAAPLTLEIDYVGAVAEEKTPWGSLKAWYR